MTAWYCLKSRDELFTADMLRDAGYAAYVPVATAKKRRGKIERLIRTPVARGYVFVQCSPESFAAVRSIGASTDFVRYIGPDGVRVPCRLPANALVPLVLAEMCGEFDGTKKPVDWKPAIGDPVRLKMTVWQGYVGKITSVGKRKIIVDMGGWSVDVDQTTGKGFGVELAA